MIVPSPRRATRPHGRASGEVSRRRLASLSAGLMLWLAPLGTLRAEEQRLTLQSAEALALRHNSDLAMARNGLKAVEAKRRSLRGAFLPKLSLEANVFVWDDEVRFDVLGDVPPPAAGCESTTLCLLPLLQAFDFGPVRDQLTSQITLRATQPLTPLYQIYKGYRAARLGEQAARHAVTLSEDQAVFRARAAYIQVKQAEAGERIANAAVSQMQSHLKTALAFRKAGLLAELDILKLRVGLAQAEGGRLRAAAGVRLARAALALQLGLGTDSSLVLTQDFADPPPPVARSFESYLQQALAQRPELRALGAQRAMATAGAQAAFGALLPQLAAVAAYQHSEGLGFATPKNAFFFGGALTWDFNWGTDYYRYREANLGKDKAATQLKKAQDGIRLQVQKAYLDLQTAAQELTISRSAVAQAEEAHRLEQRKYERASATTAEVLDAQLALSQAQQRHSATLYRWYLAKAELAAASGDSARRSLVAAPNSAPVAASTSGTASANKEHAQ